MYSIKEKEIKINFINKVIFIGFIIIHFFIQNNESNAQDTILRFLTPINNQLNVPLLPQFFISSEWEIDSSSITYTYPNLDSNINANTDLPTLLLLPDIIFDSLTINIKKQLSTKCNYTWMGSNLLKIEPMFPLIPGLKYRAVISNLKIIDPFTPGWDKDTVNAPNTSITFTTTELPHYLVNNPYLSNFEIKCRDTLKFRFNRSINPNLIELDSLLIVKKLDSTSKVNDSLFVNNWTRIDLQLWQDSTQKILYGLPANNWTPGDELNIKIRTSYINGDTIMDSDFRVNVKEYAAIHIENILLPDSTLLTTSLTYPNKGYSLIKAGDTIEIYSLRNLDSIAFSCFEMIDGQDTVLIYDNYFIITKDCYNLENIKIRAYYRIKDTLNLMLDSVAGAYISVYDSQNNLLGHYGNYQILPDDFVTINLDSLDIDKKFVKYNSDKISKIFDDNSNIRVSNLGDIDDITIIPDIDDQEPNSPPYYRYDIEIIIENNSCRNDNNIFTVTEPSWGDAPVPPALPELKFPSVIINNEYQNYYELSKIELFQGSNVYSEVFPPNTYQWMPPGGIRPTRPFSEYKVYIKSKENFTITVETELIKYSTYSIAEIGKEKDVFIRVEIENCDGKTVNHYTYSSEVPLVVNNVIPGSIVRVYAEGYDNTTNTNLGFPFDFINWKDDEGYYFSHIWKYILPNSAVEPIIVQTPKFYFTIEEDVKIKGTFKENFRIERIGIYRNDLTEPTWYKPGELNALQQASGNIIDEIDTKKYDEVPKPVNGYNDEGYMVKFLFDFNNVPNMYDLQNSQGLRIEELSERVDLKNRTQYIAGFDYNTSYSDNDNTIIEFLFKNRSELLPGRYYNSIPKGERFNFYISPGIRDVWGNQFKVNEGIKNFNFYTELPGLLVKFNEIKCLKESGDGGIELEHHSIASVSSLKSNKQIYPLPPADPYDVAFFDGGFNLGETLYPNQWLLNGWEMKRDYVANIQFNSLDDDGGDVNWDEIKDIMYGISLALTLYFSSTWVEGVIGNTPIMPIGYYQISVEALLAWLVSFGIDIISAIWNGILWLVDQITSYRDPDHLGYGLFVYGWEDYWFGASPKVKHLMNSIWNWNSQYIRYKSEVKLKKEDKYFENYEQNITY